MKFRHPLLALAALLLFSGCSSTTSAPTDETMQTSTIQTVNGSQVDYSITYDSTKWILDGYPSNEAAEFSFEHMDGDVYAMVIPERTEFEADALKQAALENAQSVAPDSTIVAEEMVTVNGVDMTMLKIDGNLSGMPFEYYGYYYTGEAGTIQFITYTSQNLTDDYATDLTDLLNGLSVAE
jgi:hypothetical protein